MSSAAGPKNNENNNVNPGGTTEQYLQGMLNKFEEEHKDREPMDYEGTQRLVADLEAARTPTNFAKVDWMIAKAKRGEYNIWKDNSDEFPQLQLWKDLSAAQLHDLAQNVQQDKYED